MPQMDFHNPLTGAQVLWMAVILVVLYFVLARWGLPEVGKVLENRSAVILRDLAAAQGAKHAADQAVAADERDDGAGPRTQRRRRSPPRWRRPRPRPPLQAAALAAKLDQKLAESEAQIDAARRQALAAIKPVAQPTPPARSCCKLTGTEPGQRCPRAARGRRPGGAEGSVEPWNIRRLTQLPGTHGSFWVFIAIVIFVVLLGRKIIAAITGMLDARTQSVRNRAGRSRQVEGGGRGDPCATPRRGRPRQLEDAKQILASAQAEAARMAAELAEEAQATAKRRERMAMERIAAAEASAVNEVRAAAIDIATAASAAVLREGLMPRPMPR